MKTGLTATLIAGLSLAVATGQTKPEISDPAALARVHIYCVDTTNLPGSQAAEVKRFFKAESKPRKLLSDFPWTMAAGCGRSPVDAIVRLEFPLLNTSGIKLGEPVKEMESDAELLKTKVVLSVSNAASGKQLYKLQASPLGNSRTGSMGPGAAGERRDAMVNAFLTLRQDLKSLPAAQP